MIHGYIVKFRLNSSCEVHLRSVALSFVCFPYFYLNRTTSTVRQIVEQIWRLKMHEMAFLDPRTHPPLGTRGFTATIGIYSYLWEVHFCQGPPPPPTHSKILKIDLISWVVFEFCSTPRFVAKNNKVLLTKCHPSPPRLAPSGKFLKIWSL
jgi:hypothetical protein